MNPVDSSKVQPGLSGFWKTAAFLLWRLPAAMRWFGRGILAGFCLLIHGIVSRWMLFAYSTRRMFTLRTMPVVVLTLLVWSYLAMMPGQNINSLTLLYGLVFAVFFSMNILPRESESHTIEVFFSLPVRRYRLVWWHLLTVLIWAVIILLYQGLFLLAIGVSIQPMELIPAVFFFSCLTIWLSTYTRNGAAAGFLSGMILLLHLFVFKKLGPIQIFRSPFHNYPPEEAWGTGQVVLVMLLSLLILIQINYRLRKSELWLR